MTDRSRFAIGRRVAYIPRPSDNPASPGERWAAEIVAADSSGMTLAVKRPTGEPLIRRNLTAADFAMGFGAGAPSTPTYDPPFPLAVEGTHYDAAGDIHIGGATPLELWVGGGGPFDGDRMIIYTEDDTNVFEDVSALNGEGPITLPGVAADNAIYVAGRPDGPVKLVGFQLDLSVGAVVGAGELVAEFWNGATWVDFATVSTLEPAPYTMFAHDFFQRAGMENLRVSQAITDTWALSDPMGHGETNYWMRFRVATAITSGPSICCFNGILNSVKTNITGFREFFGLARPRQDLAWDIGLLEPAASSPLNQDLYLSQVLDVGRTENLFANSATDRISFLAKVPGNLCTSCAIRFAWAYTTQDAGGGNIRWVVRWATSKDGDAVFRSSGAAPASVPGQQENEIIAAAPGVDVQQAQFTFLDIRHVLPVRAGGFPDGLWVSLEREGGHASDTHVGNVSLLDVAASYVTWCAGEFIG